jgi:hypothetical protein
MDIKRILLECRYLISLNKSYSDLSKILGVDEKIVFHDLNYKLKDYDTELYQRVSKILKNMS